MNNIESEAQAQTLQLIQRIYDADQSLNADAFVQLLTPDVTFHFGSNPTLVGREAVRTSVVNLFATLTSLQHHLLEVWERGNTIVFKAEVSYTRKDGKHLTLPYVDIIEKEGELLKDYAIYIDPAPLFQP